MSDKTETTTKDTTSGMVTAGNQHRDQSGRFTNAPAGPTPVAPHNSMSAPRNFIKPPTPPKTPSSPFTHTKSSTGGFTKVPNPFSKGTKPFVHPADYGHRTKTSNPFHNVPTHFSTRPHNTPSIAPAPSYSPLGKAFDSVRGLSSHTKHYLDNHHRARAETKAQESGTHQHLANSFSTIHEAFKSQGLHTQASHAAKARDVYQKQANRAAKIAQKSLGRLSASQQNHTLARMNKGHSMYSAISDSHHNALHSFAQTESHIAKHGDNLSPDEKKQHKANIATVGKHYLKDINTLNAHNRYQSPLVRTVGQRKYLGAPARAYHALTSSPAHIQREKGKTYFGGKSYRHPGLDQKSGRLNFGKHNGRSIGAYFKFNGPSKDF